MSLVAVIRSAIGETEDSNLLTEQYVVELVDHSLPCPYLGGVAGVRVIEDTDVDRNGCVKFDSWSYNFEIIFDVTPQGSEPKYKAVMQTLAKHSATLWDTVDAGDLYASLTDYFHGQDAPFKTAGVKYHIGENHDTLAFSQMLNRKFGTKVQLQIEAVLGDILKRNERTDFFNLKVNLTPKSPTQPIKRYTDWGAYS